MSTKLSNSILQLPFMKKAVKKKEKSAKEVESHSSEKWVFPSSNEQFNLLFK